VPHWHKHSHIGGGINHPHPPGGTEKGGIITDWHQDPLPHSSGRQ
jgi:hypothetical protein